MRHGFGYGTLRSIGLVVGEGDVSYGLCVYDGRLRCTCYLSETEVNMQMDENKHKIFHGT